MDLKTTLTGLLITAVASLSGCTTTKPQEFYALPGFSRVSKLQVNGKRDTVTYAHLSRSAGIRDQIRIASYGLHGDGWAFFPSKKLWLETHANAGFEDEAGELDGAEFQPENLITYLTEHPAVKQVELYHVHHTEGVRKHLPQLRTMLREKIGKNVDELALTKSINGSIALSTALPQRSCVIDGITAAYVGFQKGVTFRSYVVSPEGIIEYGVTAKGKVALQSAKIEEAQELARNWTKAYTKSIAATRLLAGMGAKTSSVLESFVSTASKYILVEDKSGNTILNAQENLYFTFTPTSSFIEVQTRKD
jgi:hypothetical protein